MSESVPPVVVEPRGGVLIITINRPEQRNAVNPAVGVGIADAIRSLEATRRS